MTEPRKAIRVDGAWIEAGPDQIEVAGRVIRGAWLVGQTDEDLAEAGIEAADIVAALPPVGLRVVGWRLDDVDGQPIEVFETAPYSADEVAEMRAACVQQIKDEAERRILARYPLTVQLNMIRHGDPLDWIDEVRAASNAIEAALPTDAAGLISFNAAQAAGWPE